MKIEIDLPDELNQQLDQAVEKTGQSKTDLVIGTLQNFLDEHVEILLVIADYEEQVRNGTLVTYTMEEVMRKVNDDYDLTESKKHEM
jgi:predicted DNA-binding protein